MNDPPLADTHKLVLTAVAATAGIATVAWVAAVLAASASGNHPAPIRFADSVVALTRLPSHTTNPADAWPADAQRALPGPILYWTAFAATVTTAVAVAYIGWRWWRRRSGHALGIRPDAGFARPHDLTPLRVSRPTAGRLTVGTSGRRRLIAVEADASLAVIGPTGCGKTAGFAIPALLEWSGPVLATSVKTDLLDRSLDHRANAGTVWVYDPTSATDHPSAAWSPLDACTTWQNAQRTAAAMCDAARGERDGVGDAEYWYTQARKALAPHLYAAAVGKRTLGDVVAWIDTQEDDEPDDLLLARPTPETTAAWHSLVALRSKESRVRSSIAATVENVLAAYADPGVQRAATDGHRINLDDWLDGNNTIYLIAPSHEQHRLRPVLTVLAQAAIRHAFDRANANGGRLTHPCLLLLDEAGNTAALPDLPAYAATARSHGVTLVSIWQDLAQINALYGRRAHTVLNNHRARLFGRGIADNDTLDYLSRLIGETRSTTRQHSTDPHGRTSTSEHHQYRRAAGLDALRRLPADTGVLLYGAELPAAIRLRPWYQDAALSALACRKTSSSTALRA